MSNASSTTPWDSQQDVTYVKTSVLPSMCKDCIYHVILINRESRAHVITAYCTCPDCRDAVITLQHHCNVLKITFVWD